MPIKKFKFLENIAIADVAFEAYGSSLNELFKNSALATEEVMVDIKTVKQIKKKIIKIKSKDVKDLLFDFINELIYQKDTNSLLFSKFNIKVFEKQGYNLIAICSGEKINPKQHKLRADAKAITLHMFNLKKTRAGYKARIILDV